MEEKTVEARFIPAIELVGEARDVEGTPEPSQPVQQGEFNPYLEFPMYVFDHLAVPIAYALGFRNRRQFLRAEKVRARKPHICELCGREISAGSEAYAVTFALGSWEWSSKFTVYYHPGCYRAEVEGAIEKIAATIRWVLLRNAEQRKDIFSRPKGSRYPVIEGWDEW